MEQTHKREAQRKDDSPEHLKAKLFCFTARVKLKREQQQVIVKVTITIHMLSLYNKYTMT